MYVCVGLLRESCVSNGSCYRVLSRDMRWGQAHAIHSQPLTINEGCERCSRPEAPWCETPPLPRSALDRGVMLVAFAYFINVHRALIITYIEVINIMFLEIYILKNKWTSLFSNIIIIVLTCSGCRVTSTELRSHSVQTQLGRRDPATHTSGVRKKRGSER